MQGIASDARRLREEQGMARHRPRNSTWTVMFVDLEGSTQMKYRAGAATVAAVVTRLFSAVQDLTDRKRAIKFTGDGAMVVFTGDRAGCQGALAAAEQILLRHDRDNLLFESPQVHIRIGIATGECYEVGTIGLELSGTAADLAARLCAEADQDTILVDEQTRTLSDLPPYRFRLLDRRLSLRGVPAAGVSQVFFAYRVPYFVRPHRPDPFSRGLLALYRDRNALQHDLSPTRLLWLAAEGSELIVAGRTLIAWTRLAHEIRYVVERKRIRIKFLLTSPVACRNLLEPTQLAAIQRDYPVALSYYQDLQGTCNGHVRVRSSDVLILDAVTLAEINLPKSGYDLDLTESRLIASQDINAAPGDDKPSVLWACTCPNDNSGVGGAHIPLHSCVAGGLHSRTVLLWEQAKELQTP